MQAHDDPELRRQVREHEIPVVMREFVVKLDQWNKDAGQCANTPGVAPKGLVSMRPNPTPVCRSCKRALPRDHFDRGFVRGKPASLRKYCRECRQSWERTPIDNGDGTFSIPLTQGQYALIDAADVDMVSEYRWCAVRGYSTFYAKAGGGRSVIPVTHMHRLVLGLAADDPHDADHINCNGLDNRRQNLRAVTRAENTRRAVRNVPGKSSRFRGVHWMTAARKWRATIHVAGELKRLGRFDDEVEAALAYDRAARTFHGEFAVLNFPDEGGPDVGSR